jgi:DNA-binding NarL/FixJ family response regulator
MHQRKRIYYSETQKSLMWNRWQRGESLQQIAALFDRHYSSVAGVLIGSGGIRPPTRRRSLLALRPAEREEISRGVATGKSVRSIALSLNRAPSTISRELRRNQGRQSYRAAQAD